MNKLIAKNDDLIEQLIEDENYLITKEGEVKKKGKKLGRKDKEGYVEIYYKGVRLKLHRIIYRKFKGNLDKELVIEHKDGNAGNCESSNLIMCTQQKNIEYKNRRLKRTGKS